MQFSSTRISSTTNINQVQTTAITRTNKSKDKELQKIANKIRKPKDLGGTVMCDTTVHPSTNQTSTNQQECTNVSNKNTTNFEIFLTDQEGANSKLQHHQPPGVVIIEDDDVFDPRGHRRYANALNKRNKNVGSIILVFIIKVFSCFEK